MFTIQPDAKRRFVATIYAVECLDDRHAQEARKIFEQRGWFDLMKNEIRDAGGDAAMLDAVEWANDIVNVRFRLENVRLFPSGTYARWDVSEQRRFNRYQLFNYECISSTSDQSSTAERAGSYSLPVVRPFKRTGIAPLECDPKHAQMQAQLMQELAAEYPSASILREEDFVDVIMRTLDETVLFEIKSDLDPRSVIRRALGQILEYAYYPTRQETSPTKLVIVGRRRLSETDQTYLNRLRQEFHLPIEYRVVNPD